VNKPLVFFNASVVIAGVLSPRGGSARVINWVKNGKIQGVISEIIFNEVLRHSEKINKSEEVLASEILKFNFMIVKAPSRLDSKFEKIVLDLGDVHVLTSALRSKVEYLITLDAKHILSLSSKVKDFKIVTPGQLIKELR
jgi:predicted nucleic acid-binding protein